MTQHADVLYLSDMLDLARTACELAQPFDRATYDANLMLQLALERLVQNIGEAARHVSPERRQQLDAIAWHQAIGMRHRLVHDYGNVDADIIWQSVTEDLPPLIEELEKVVPSVPPE